MDKAKAFAQRRKPRFDQGAERGAEHRDSKVVGRAGFEPAKAAPSRSCSTRTSTSPEASLRKSGVGKIGRRDRIVDARLYRGTMFLSPRRFLLQFPLAPETKDGHRDEAKRKREPILARHWDRMNPSITDGNPADERIIRNYCALFYAKIPPTSR